jgi:hypothetical protein
MSLALLGSEPDTDHLNGGVYSFNARPEWHNRQLVRRNINSYFEFAFGSDDRLSFVRLLADRP